MDDGGNYHASRTQRWLWSRWLDFWASVNRDADGYRKVLMINGDLGELDCKRRSAQLITQNKSTILNMVRDVLVPASWDALYILRGTDAHEGRSSWLEEEIGKDLEAITSDVDVHSWWQIRAEISGVKFDVAHHGSMGKTPWTRVNSAVKLATTSLWDYSVDMKSAPPDIIVRSHNHIYAEAKVNNTRAYFTPSWTSKTAYAYRAGYENTISSIGGMVFYCVDGRCLPQSYMYSPEKEKRIWAMKL